jgi:hypothetical protein
MKPAKALRVLSHEHHEALVLARQAANVDPTSEGAHRLRKHLLARWTAEFEPHFALEERQLLPALVAAGHLLAASEGGAQHADLRALSRQLRAGDTSALGAWGGAMQAHVRYEERVLFPLAQDALDPAVLAEAAAPAGHPLST